VKASGWGYMAKQCFSFGYIYEAVKGLDKLGCMGITLCFSTHMVIINQLQWLLKERQRISH
ncbi:MAG: hypothetical protein QXE50_08350, partial [Nitrososphaerota archaeon]